MGDEVTAALCRHQSLNCLLALVCVHREIGDVCTTANLASLLFVSSGKFKSFKPHLWKWMTCKVSTNYICRHNFCSLSDRRCIRSYPLTLPPSYLLFSLFVIGFMRLPFSSQVFIFRANEPIIFNRLSFTSQNNFFCYSKLCYSRSWKLENQPYSSFMRLYDNNKLYLHDFIGIW